MSETKSKSLRTPMALKEIDPRHYIPKEIYLHIHRRNLNSKEYEEGYLCRIVLKHMLENKSRLSDVWLHALNEDKISALNFENFRLEKNPVRGLKGVKIPQPLHFRADDFDEVLSHIYEVVKKISPYKPKHLPVKSVVRRGLISLPRGYETEIKPERKYQYIYTILIGPEKDVVDAWGVGDKLDLSRVLRDTVEVIDFVDSEIESEKLPADIMTICPRCNEDIKHKDNILFVDCPNCKASFQP